MGKTTEIAWTTHTFNLAWGCTRISEGCRFCYAEPLAKRYGFDVWGKNAVRRTMGDNYWNQPLSWNRAAQRAGERKQVFCSSMADVFEDHATNNRERPKLWKLIKETPWLDWQLLTKRPENITAMLPDDWDSGYANVWLGTSIEDRRVIHRIDELQKVPSKIRFLSCEPLIGSLDLKEDLARYWDDSIYDPVTNTQGSWAEVEYGQSGIHWVIIGGESGHNARPFNLAWAHELVAQCQVAGVAVFVKQLGSKPCVKLINSDKSTGADVVPLFFNDSKAGDPDEWPEDLRIREMPHPAKPISLSNTDDPPHELEHFQVLTGGKS